MKKAALISPRLSRTQNAVHLPQALRDAIPGPDLPGCDRLLILSGISASRVDSPFYGERVQLKLRVEESGKLTGAFDLNVFLTVEAAEALAGTLHQLAARDTRDT
jgi:hypothetical protein